jgi:hypothetical protein
MIVNYDCIVAMIVSYDHKTFTVQVTGANLLKLYSLSLMIRLKKLVCFLLTKLFSLV